MSNKKDKIKGGKADKMSVKDIAKKFGIPVSKVEKELRDGTKIEMEHVNSKALAKEIAMDHLVEFPDYYTRLKKMEKEAEKKWASKIEESRVGYIKRMLSENLNLTVIDETPASTGYEIYHNGKKAGALEVGKFNKLLGDDALEVVAIRIDDGFSRMGIGSKAIKALWGAHPNINTLFLMPTEESRAFWEKLGAKRLNNTYYIIQRGH